MDPSLSIRKSLWPVRIAKLSFADQSIQFYKHLLSTNCTQLHPSQGESLKETAPAMNPSLIELPGPGEAKAEACLTQHEVSSKSSRSELQWPRAKQGEINPVWDWNRETREAS